MATVASCCQLNTNYWKPLPMPWVTISKLVLSTAAFTAIVKIYYTYK